MFEHVQRLIGQYPALVDVGFPQSSNAIDAAEQQLGTQFPVSFREYLCRWGTLSFGPNEYFGLGSKINDVVSKTERIRDAHGLPQGFVVLCDHDGDEYVCLDTSAMRDCECRVVVWNPTARSIDRPRAATFEAFLQDDMEAFVDED
jgi:hypothetical protein